MKKICNKMLIIMLFFSMSLVLVSCKDDGGELPPVTTLTEIQGLSFSGAEYTYQHDAVRTIAITGTLPAGAQVNYYYNDAPFSGATDAGEYLVTAKFSVDATKYEKVEDMSAILKINKATLLVQIIEEDKFIDGSLTEGDSLPQIYSNSTLGTVSLDAGQELLAGWNDYTWTFTPTDSKNYIPSTGVIRIYAEEKEEGVDLLGVTFPGDSFEYDGTEQSIFADNLPEGVSVQYFGNRKINVGTHEVLAQLSYGTQTRSLSATITITKRIVNINLDSKTTEYGTSTPLTYAIAEGSKDVVSGDNVNINITRVAGDNVGVYNISATYNNSNYQMSFSSGATYTITPRQITIQVDDKESVYGDSFVSFSTTVISGSIVGTDNLGIVVTKESGVDAGAYSLAATYNNTNYNVQFIDGVYVVTPRAISVQVLPKQVTYGDEEVELTFSQDIPLVLGDDVEELNIELSREQPSNINVGEYDIVATYNNANYTITFSDATYRINRREISFTIDNKTSVYGEDLQGLTFDITAGSLVYSDTITLTKVNGTTAGEYAISASLSDNYSASWEEGVYTISPRPLTIKIDNKNIVYGDDEQQLTWQLISGDVLSTDEAVLGISLSRANNINAGSYTITGECSNTNYIVTWQTGTYTIAQKEFDLSAVAIVTVSKEYDGVAVGAQLTGIDSSALPTGLLLTSYSDYEGSFGPLPFDTTYVNAGTYSYVAEFDVTNENNYAIVFDGGRYTSYRVSSDLVISKSEIDVSAITAQNKNVTYSGEAYTIFSSDVSGVPVGVLLTITSDSDEGYIDAGTYSYTITPYATNSNYVLVGATPITVDLIISPQQIDVSSFVAQNVSDEYSGSESNIFQTPWRLISNFDIETLKDVNITFSLENPETLLLDAGTYNYTLTLSPKNSNYVLQGETVTYGVITINKISYFTNISIEVGVSESVATVTAEAEGDGQFEYAVSSESDATNLTWQDSNIFTELDDGTYYFFVRVKEDTNHNASNTTMSEAIEINE